MPFDPAQPATGSPLASQLIRDQFNALAALISAQEVRIAALETALADTARNPTAVGTLSDPPSATQVQAILDVHNQLLAALLRV